MKTTKCFNRGFWKPKTAHIEKDYDKNLVKCLSLTIKFYVVAVNLFRCIRNCIHCSGPNGGFCQRCHQLQPFRVAPGKLPQRVDRPMIYCYGCQDQCITQCKSQDREVSQLECNFWGSEQAVCKCCCGLPSSTPPPKPIIWNQCPTEETNEYFLLRNSLIDCRLCVNGCKTKCDAIGATVAREVCFQDFNVGTTILIDGVLACPCCCKPKPPPPPACPCSESCGVDINIQISSVAGQASRKYELPHSSSSTAEL
ncbi:uncharacterized protein LOC113326617 isoform X2 [Papaver somniferum]|uniref:uncharacterized protein LOC113326617 isoform X2 n=1 Tax=Papaver somniferum TaxID=3469 RepID=UPI000E6F58CF|nr:uncharacterized protein LOC113326617 isoform X2 [Papaver somniferum]